MDKSELHMEPYIISDDVSWLMRMEDRMRRIELGEPFHITNFDKTSEERYRETIRKWDPNGDILFIKSDAYWRDGTFDPGTRALWCRKDVDLTDFWRLMDEM